MSKWIAEFELEDGDRMPEHMDLNYKGAKIDFYCRPLEQEPFINKPCVSEKACEHDKQMILDKIRAEIEQLPITDTAVRLVIEIIDKYKAESESDEE